MKSCASCAILAAAVAELCYSRGSLFWLLLPSLYSCGSQVILGTIAAATCKLLGLSSLCACGSQAVEAIAYEHLRLVMPSR